MSSRDRPSAPFLILATMIVLLSIAAVLTMWFAGS
jgi:hypothetical protein